MAGGMALLALVLLTPLAAEARAEAAEASLKENIFSLPASPSPSSSSGLLLLLLRCPRRCCSHRRRLRLGGLS